MEFNLKGYGPKEVNKAIEKTEAFAQDVLVPIFGKVEDRDLHLACICATLATAADNFASGDTKLNLKKKADVDDEAEEQAAEAEEPATKKRRKQGKEEDETDFLKRAAIELGTEMLEGLEVFGVKRYQAKLIAMSIAGALINSFDLEELMFKELLEKLAK